MYIEKAAIDFLMDPFIQFEDAVTAVPAKQICDSRSTILHGS